MSAVMAQTKTREERPTSLVAAVVLIVIGAIANVSLLPWVPEDELATVVTVSIIISVLWLAAAYGTWQRIRWAAGLAFVVTLISGLLSAPGIPFAEETLWKVLSTVGTVHAVAVCWLLAMKSTRDALQ